MPKRKPRRRRLPKKVERCVRAVKRRRGVRNAYAVCEAVAKKGARRNPAESWCVEAVSSRGTFYLTADKSFSRNPKAAKRFDRRADAEDMAALLQQQAPKGVKVYVGESGLHGAVAQAAKLFEAFTGRRPTEKMNVRVPEPKAALAIGTIDQLWYTTVRDGRLQSFRHPFKKGSRPILAVSADGTQFLALGGAFKFTDRGFIDK